MMCHPHLQYNHRLRLAPSHLAFRPGEAASLVPVSHLLCFRKFL